MALASARPASTTRAAKARSTSSPTQQSLKSAQTRARLIDATIHSIVKFGYANTTTTCVVAEAGLSRGALLHHFENGDALIKATIVELHEKRLRAFRRAAETNNHEASTLVDAYWRQLQKPAFIAFHELALAARTNSGLARILHPLQIEFRDKFNALAVQLFPEWDGDPVGFKLAMTLSQTVTEGLAISLQTMAVEEAMVQPMLQLLEDRIKSLKPDSAKD